MTVRQRTIASNIFIFAAGLAGSVAWMQVVSHLLPPTWADVIAHAPIWQIGVLAAYGVFLGWAAYKLESRLQENAKHECNRNS